jgi:hypothetical protein
VEFVGVDMVWVLHVVIYLYVPWQCYIIYYDYAAMLKEECI